MNEDTTTEGAIEIETEAMDVETTEEDKEEEEVVEEEEEEDDPFSDRNRWKRGGIIDPDATEW